VYQVYPVRVSYMNFINYSYILVDSTSSQAAIVDPAWELDRITVMLDRLNVELTAILLTHSHHDHVNLVNPLVERYNPRVYMSAEEIQYYQFHCKNLHPFEDLETIRLAYTQISCLSTPGHTAGSACFLLEDCMFTGDTVFIEGCGMCGSRGGSADSMFESIQRIKQVVHPDVRIYPGHSYGKKPGALLRYVWANNIYFQLEKKDHFVAFRMRKNQTNLLDFR